MKKTLLILSILTISSNILGADINQLARKALMAMDKSKSPLKRLFRAPVVIAQQYEMMNLVGSVTQIKVATIAEIIKELYINNDKVNVKELTFTPNGKRLLRKLITKIKSSGEVEQRQRH